MIRLHRPFWSALLLTLLFVQAPAQAQVVAQHAPINAPSLDVVVQGDGDRARAVRAAQQTAADYTAAAHADANAGGMPQLDFANPLTISQVVWLFVIFGLLVFLATHYLLPPVAEVLEDRRKRISADLDAARDARAEAETAEAAHRDETARARAEAQASVAAAMQAAQSEAHARADALATKLEAQIAEAETRIHAARDAAMGALREAATDAATALVQRLSGLDEKAAVDAAVQRELAARNLQTGAA